MAFKRSGDHTPTSRRERNTRLWFVAGTITFLISAGYFLRDGEITTAICSGLFGSLWLVVLLVGPSDDLKREWVLNEKTKLRDRLDELG